MFTHRHLIVHLICASSLLAVDSHAQTVETRTGQIIPGSAANQRQNNNNDSNVPSRSVAPQIKADSRDVPGQDARRVTQAPAAQTRVIPGQDQNRSSREESREARVIPGQDRERPSASIIIPSVIDQRSARVLPASQGRVIPGSGVVGGVRPIVTARQLPQTVIINRNSATCPYVALTPIAISKKGDQIELNDGSVWDVRHRQRRTVRKWSPGDTILIQTGSFYSWSTFQLVNYTRRESVDVELSLAPNWRGRSSHWVMEVNPYNGYVRLEDGSIWRMSTNELAGWQANDDVIVGLSKDWFSDQFSYVLINPRVKNRFIATFSVGMP